MSNTTDHLHIFSTMYQLHQPTQFFIPIFGFLNYPVIVITHSDRFPESMPESIH
jgi:hypothetical protein